MPKWGKFDFKEFKELADAFQRAMDDRVIEGCIRDLLNELAMRALRKIKKRTPSNNGELRRFWRIGSIERHGNAFVVEIVNNLEYASYVEYGFRSHWVPGYWSGSTFVYDPSYEPPEGESSGMYVGKKDGWVDGRFMMTISMKEIEKQMPKYLEKKQTQLLEQIMHGRKSIKGGGSGGTDDNE